VDQELAYLNVLPTALVLMGGWALARHRQWVVIMPIFFYVAFLAAIGPGGIAARYFLPIMPLLAYALVAGVPTAAVWLAALRKPPADAPAAPRRAWAVPLAVGLCVAISLPKIVGTIYIMRQPDFYRAYERGLWADYLDLGGALAERGTPGTDRVLAPWFTVVHYLSRLEATSTYAPPQVPTRKYASGPPEDFVRAAATGGYRFVVVPLTQDAEDTETPVWSRAVTAGLKAAEVFRDPPERFGRLLLFERAGPSSGEQAP
jgi:hypothetical protein